MSGCIHRSALEPGIRCLLTSPKKRLCSHLLICILGQPGYPNQARSTWQEGKFSGSSSRLCESETVFWRLLLATTVSGITILLRFPDNLLSKLLQGDCFPNQPPAFPTPRFDPLVVSFLFYDISPPLLKLLFSWILFWRSRLWGTSFPFSNSNILHTNLGDKLHRSLVSCTWHRGDMLTQLNANYIKIKGEIT